MPCTRNHAERFVAGFSDYERKQAVATVIARLGMSAFTDEALDEIATALEFNDALREKLNTENRAIANRSLAVSVREVEHV